MRTWGRIAVATLRRARSAASYSGSKHWRGQKAASLQQLEALTSVVDDALAAQSGKLGSERASVYPQVVS